MIINIKYIDITLTITSSKDYLLTEKITSNLFDWKLLVAFIVKNINPKDEFIYQNIEIQKILEFVTQEEEEEVIMYLNFQYLFVCLNWITGEDVWKNGLCALGSYQHLSEIDSYLKQCNLEDNMDNRYIIAFSVMLSKIINSGFWKMPLAFEKYFKENKIIK